MGSRSGAWQCERGVARGICFIAQKELRDGHAEAAVRREAPRQEVTVDEHDAVVQAALEVKEGGGGAAGRPGLEQSGLTFKKSGSTSKLILNHAL